MQQSLSGQAATLPVLTVWNFEISSSYRDCFFLDRFFWGLLSFEVDLTEPLELTFVLPFPASIAAIRVTLAPRRALCVAFRWRLYASFPSLRGHLA
jgi:hypothetical protein